MKIIDLLNKIANGEEVPKKIKYLTYEYEFNQVDKKYQRWFNGLSYGLGEDRRLDIILDDEVEIIEEEPRDIEVCGSLFTRSEYDKLAHSEEEKKIPEKLDFIFEDKFIIEHFKSGAMNYLSTFEAIKQLYDKQCEIIDYLKSKGE